MRVHELAKALNLTSKELLVKLKAFKIDAKSAMSTLDADAVNRTRKAITKSLPAKKPASSTVKPSLTKSPVAVKKAVTMPSSRADAPKRAAPTPPTPLATRSGSAPAGAAPVPSRAAEPVGRARPVTSRVGVGSARPVAVAQVAPPSPHPLHVTAVQPAAPVAKPTQDAPVTKVATPHTVAPAPVEEPAVSVPEPGVMRRLEVTCPISVKDLAARMEIKPSDLIKHLMQQQKVFASIVQLLDEPTAAKAAHAFHFEIAPQPTLEEQVLNAARPDPSKLVSRAPVVTFMGHVDHGKTSLLDAIREAKVAEKEAGGITQHIGAYEVLLEKGHVTLLDTPGHEAFSALRARGANATDIVVLVVAADDGVMPQTIEAIDHAKAAGVPILVAINKMDKPDANPQKVKQQLSQHELIGEDWGGKTIMVPVSAKTREGIDTLLEMLLLEAELLELKADPMTQAQGVVIEAKQTKDRGPVATLLVQQGTLRLGETFVVGPLAGRVRAMSDDRGHRIKEAGPASRSRCWGCQRCRGRAISSSSCRMRRWRGSSRSSVRNSAPSALSRTQSASRSTSCTSASPKGS